jgi:hypothetical protein
MAKENSGFLLRGFILFLCPCVPTLPFPSLKQDNSTCLIGLLWGIQNLLEIRRLEISLVVPL